MASEWQRGHFWCSSRDCHHLALLCYHLPNICTLRHILAPHVAQFLKPLDAITRLQILAFTETMDLKTIYVYKPDLDETLQTFCGSVAGDTVSVKYGDHWDEFAFACLQHRVDQHVRRPQVVMINILGVQQQISCNAFEIDPIAFRQMV